MTLGAKLGSRKARPRPAPLHHRVLEQETDVEAPSAAAGMLDQPVQGPPGPGRSIRLGSGGRKSHSLPLQPWQEGTSKFATLEMNPRRAQRRQKETVSELTGGWERKGSLGPYLPWQGGQLHLGGQVQTVPSVRARQLFVGGYKQEPHVVDLLAWGGSRGKRAWERGQRFLGCSKWKFLLGLGSGE